VALKGPAENLYDAWLAGGRKGLEAEYDRDLMHRAIVDEHGNSVGPDYLMYPDPDSSTPEPSASPK
jgi:hypothetical protein